MILEPQGDHVCRSAAGQPLLGLTRAFSVSVSARLRPATRKPVFRNYSVRIRRQRRRAGVVGDATTAMNGQQLLVRENQAGRLLAEEVQVRNAVYRFFFVVCHVGSFLLFQLLR